MNLAVAYLRELSRAAGDGWNRFWFTPSDVATLALVRIGAGAMLFYTHFVWGLGFRDFLSPEGLLPRTTFDAYYGANAGYAFTHLWMFRSPAALWTAHLAALAVFAMFAAGLFTRVTSILTCLLTLSYIHRLPLVLFGTDQLNAMLALYLALAPCGQAYSLDRWRAARKRERYGAGGPLPDAPPSTTANIAARLIQLHMCAIYFFAGIGKLQGDSWWAGYALWGAAANMEYRTVDLTWLAHVPVLMALLTQLTAYWELFFCVLIWPRLLRPLMLFVALALHLSIGICMGLMTFGLIMPIAVYAFVPPEWTRRLVERRPEVATTSGAGEGSIKSESTKQSGLAPSATTGRRAAPRSGRR
ncbi:MAG: HTTM domain-containing protein [Pirellula sp.]|nr:HTTM domain-containing protein [Pirellula sp.]